MEDENIKSHDFRVKFINTVRNYREIWDTTYRKRKSMEECWEKIENYFESTY